MRRLDEDLEAADVEPIEAALLVDLGSSFCGVPPGELTLDVLQPGEDQP